MPGKPKEDKVETRRCLQTKCQYYLQGGCCVCLSCHAEPYIINTACNRCLSCENVPGALRWDDPKAGKIGQQQTIPPEVEKEIMAAIIQGAQKRLDELDKPMEVIR